MRFAFALVALSMSSAVYACSNDNVLPPVEAFDTSEDGAVPEDGGSADGVVPDSGSSATDIADSGMCTSGSFVTAFSGGSRDHDDSVNGVAVDADENTWIVGTFVGNARWGDVELTATDDVQTTGFVAKLDAAGKIVFARAVGQATPGNPSVASRIRVDAAGNVFVAGTFGGTLDYDDVHLTKTGASAAFVLCLDATGKALWGAASASTTGSGANDIAIDANGDIYLVGSYSGQAFFGTFALDFVDRAPAPFVAKYSPTNHAWIWARGFGGTEINSGGIAYGVSLTSDGQSVYAVGQTASAMDVDGHPFLVSGGGFFLKLATRDGHTIWATVAAPSDTSEIAYPHAATTDAAGNLYVAGEFSGTLHFDAAKDDAAGSNDAGANGVSVTAAGGRNVFVVKYDFNGTPVWVERAGQGSVARGDDVAFDGANALYVSGYKEGILTFGGISLPSTGNAFVARYDTSGHAVWAAGDDSSDLSSNEAKAIWVGSPTSGVVMGGIFAKTTSFGALTLTSSGEDDGFVIRACN